MLPLTRKDGTPIKPHVRPFAKYVQENYRGDGRDRSWGCDEKAQQGFFGQKTKAGALRLSEDVFVRDEPFLSKEF